MVEEMEMCSDYHYHHNDHSMIFPHPQETTRSVSVAIITVEGEGKNSMEEERRPFYRTCVCRHYEGCYGDWLLGGLVDWLIE